MDVASVFNVKAFADVVVRVGAECAVAPSSVGVGGAEEKRDGGGGAAVQQAGIFYLNRFPLMARSLFFHRQLLSAVTRGGAGATDSSSTADAPGAIAVDLPGFPGGPRVFEVLARHCYDPSTPSNLEHWSAADVTLLLCGARLLDIADVIRLADDAIERDVLPYLPRVVDALAALEPVRSSLNAAAAAKATASPEKAATPSSPDAAADGHHSATSLSLSSSDGVRGMPPAMQTAVAAAVADVFGRCLNAAALRFSPLPTLHQLAPPLFAGVVRLTREYECPATVIQAAVSGYLKSFVDVATSVGERSLSVRPSAVVCAEFLEVLSSAGRIESIAFADAVYLLLETLLKSIGGIEERVELCSKLKELHLWECLSHVSIERAYRCTAVPDRFVTISLMSENRHLLKLHEEYADEVDRLRALLQSHGISSNAAPPALPH